MHKLVWTAWVLMTTRRTRSRSSREPYGMVLVTGPTGSGKTTTLYAAITEINKARTRSSRSKIRSSISLPGVLQIPVNEKKGLTLRGTAFDPATRP